MPAEGYQQLDDAIKNGGPANLLNYLVRRLREQKRYFELFEALKMQTRDAMGLPPLQDDGNETLTSEQRDRLEKGLLDACREVGSLLLRDGQIREGWTYLRPLGEQEAIAEHLSHITIDDETREPMVELLLYEGIDPPRGFSEILENYGTCNAITALESHLAGWQKNVQQAVVEKLVRHIHAELTTSVRSHIEEKEGQAPNGQMLAQFLPNREWLFGEFSYHLDTTHLASTVRLARILSDAEALTLARDLTEYGRRLDEKFQYAGDEPFVDFYPSHAVYLSALLGERIQEAVDFFRNQAERVNVREQGSHTVEVYIDLLARLEQYADAIRATIELIPHDVHTTRLAPSLLELSQAAGDFSQLLEISQERDEVLGYTAGLLGRQTSAQHPKN